MKHKSNKRRISGRVAYSCPWFHLVEDKVVYASGAKSTYSYVVKNPAAVILAFANKREFFIVGQWRYPTKRFSWEIPMGTGDKGESPLECAKRELAEEIGVGAKKWSHLGVFYFANGICNQIGHVFAARDLFPAKAVGDEMEDLEIKKITTAQFERLVKKGTIVDAGSIAAYYQAKLHLRL